MKIISTEIVDVLTFVIFVITTAINNSNADGKYDKYNLLQNLSRIKCFLIFNI